MTGTLPAAYGYNQPPAFVQGDYRSHHELAGARDRVAQRLEGGLAVARLAGPFSLAAEEAGGGGAQFFRGAKPGESPTFTPRDGEFRVDPATGYVRTTHGVSVFDNPESVISGGRQTDTSAH